MYSYQHPENDVAQENDSKLNPTFNKTKIAIIAGFLFICMLAAGFSTQVTNSNGSLRSMNLVAALDTPGADSGVICPDLTWELVNGKDLYSSSKEFRLDFMFDGSMILYQQSGNNWKSLWSSKNNSKWAGDFSFEADGDVLVYKNGPWLAVNQVANPDSFIALGNDGNLAQYSRSDLSPLWSSNTATKGIAPNLDIEFLNTKCPTKAPSPAPTRTPTPGPTSEEQHELYELTVRLKAIEEKAAKTDRVSTWFFDAKAPPVQEYQG